MLWTGLYSSGTLCIVRIIASYIYDKNNRLLKQTDYDSDDDGKITISYNYDNNGNQLSLSRGYTMVDKGGINPSEIAFTHLNS